MTIFSALKFVGIGAVLLLVVGALVGSVFYTHGHTHHLTVPHHLSQVESQGPGKTLEVTRMTPGLKVHKNNIIF